jgi:hypothetical protein
MGSQEPSRDECWFERPALAVALAGAALLLFCLPFLSASAPSALWAYRYLFVVWGVVIVLLFLTGRRPRQAATCDEDEGSGGVA